MITSLHVTEGAGITYPQGFRAGAARGGLKTAGDDVGVIVSERPAAAAGLFTTNRVHAPCVDLAAAVARRGAGRAIVVNAGNANACTGQQGVADAARMQAVAARTLGVEPDELVPASTGVIGRPLPLGLVEQGIAGAVAALGAGPACDERLARAIMTTDTRVKQVAVRCASDAWPGEMRLAGVCKGAGMIAPRLGPPHATMLAYLSCDGAVAPDALQRALTGAACRTFNRLTVDGDTSTNDMLVVLANGASGVPAEGAAAETDLREALTAVCERLAREVARDGEGATRLVTVTVEGAPTEREADAVARAVAESPLVKTAIYGGDPNWGRILAAAGRSGAALTQSECAVWLGDVCVCAGGAAAPYDVRQAEAALAGPEVQVRIVVGGGPASVTWWTCDYSYDYVRINAEYHT